MKQSQWVLAACVMAGLMFVVTFAMNYLGSSRPQENVPTVRAAREIVFPDVTTSVPVPFGILEREERTRGHLDFWFYNPNEQAVQVGLQRKSCKCGSVEVFVLPEERRPWVARSAAAFAGVRPVGILNAISLTALALRQIQHGVEGHELLEKTEKTAVPAGQIGWVAVGWGDRTGKQSLEASLWFDDPIGGKVTALNVALFFHEAIRVRSTLSFGVLRESALEAGVSQSILVWSSTRDSLRLEAEADKTRDSARNDPFLVGKPEPLSAAEAFALSRTNNTAPPSTSEDTRGSIRCAYRIPIRLQALAPDGKTPFDIGPFNRSVHISSPDVDGGGKTVLVTGRVIGSIDIGTEDQGGRVNFRDFPRGRGRAVTVPLENRERKVDLSVDRQRTSRFLRAEVVPVTPAPQNLVQAWTLRIEIPPSKADGEFPRPNDPLYEDSAVYLNLSAGGGPQRSVRIPVAGRATGR